MRKVRTDIKDARLEALAQHASKVLDSVTGPSSQLVDAVWIERMDSKQRPVVLLELKDPWGSASTSFSPEELQQELQLKDRLYTLWGDLLQSRSDRLAESLRETQLQD